MKIKLIKKFKSFEGWTEFYEHHSLSTKTKMRFAIFRPDREDPCPVIYWLSGLTCNEENFMQKAGAQKKLSELGIYLVAPDTSPRDCGFEGEDDLWSFGSGASFYLDAKQEPWKKTYQMYTYISDELPKIISHHFLIDPSKQSIMGHSMGGHGAITIGLQNEIFKSISGFAPICAPSQSEWGQYAFTCYLGENKEEWRKYDSCKLIEHACYSKPMLIDQGSNDQFLLEGQLQTNLLEQICKKKNYPAKIRYHQDFDHSYYFISSFLDQHLEFHHQNFLEMK